VLGTLEVANFRVGGASLSYVELVSGLATDTTATITHPLNTEWVDVSVYYQQSGGNDDFDGSWVWANSNVKIGVLDADRVRIRNNTGSTYDFRVLINRR